MLMFCTTTLLMDLSFLGQTLRVAFQDLSMIVVVMAADPISVTSLEALGESIERVQKLKSLNVFIFLKIQVSMYIHK